MQHIHNTVAALKRGEVVLVPTDTNYAGGRPVEY